MLIKEYRIPLPLSTTEFEIADLYTIQKKSRVDSMGPGSGVEFLKNEPYVNGPKGSSGQYTYKIYHVEKHIPAWIASFVPAKALQVEEEGWSAYPYGRSRHRCPFFDESRFSIQVDTLIVADDATSANAHNLSPEELAVREVDVIDVVKEQVPGEPYKAEFDPSVFVSKQTGRGPLAPTWLEDYRRKYLRFQSSKEVEESAQDGPAEQKESESAPPIMCAYELARINFQYWGLQTRVERWIDFALRKQLLSAYKQIWCWQDEWLGLDLAAVRKMEEETGVYLKRLMHQPSRGGSSAKASASAGLEHSASAPALALAAGRNPKKQSQAAAASQSASASANGSTNAVNELQQKQRQKEGERGTGKPAVNVAEEVDAEEALEA